MQRTILTLLQICITNQKKMFNGNILKTEHANRIVDCVHFQQTIDHQEAEIKYEHCLDHQYCQDQKI